MTWREFEFVEGNSRKFWKIEFSGATFTVHYGRIGTDGQKNTKDFPSEEKAKAACEKLIAEKTGKGYVEVGAGHASNALATLIPGKAGSPLASVSDAWKQIEAAIRGRLPAETRPLPAPATEEELRQVEEAIGVSLPNGVRESYLLHNGSNGIYICEQGALMPLLKGQRTRAGVLETWQAMLQVGEDMEDEESEPVGPIRKDWWNRAWVPLTDNECGDSICLDFAPKKGGKPGQVIEWWHEQGPTKVLAGSFTEWLAGLGQQSP